MLLKRCCCRCNYRYFYINKIIDIFILIFIFHMLLTVSRPTSKHTGQYTCIYFSIRVRGFASVFGNFLELLRAHSGGTHERRAIFPAVGNARDTTGRLQSAYESRRFVRNGSEKPRRRNQIFRTTKITTSQTRSRATTTTVKYRERLTRLFPFTRHTKDRPSIFD